MKQAPATLLQTLVQNEQKAAYVETPTRSRKTIFKKVLPKKTFSLAGIQGAVNVAESRPINLNTDEGKEALLQQKKEEARRKAGHELISNYATVDMHQSMWEVIYKIKLT